MNSFNDRALRAPPFLKKGDTIGVIAPASQAINQTEISKGIKFLHELGFKTQIPESFWPGSAHLSDTDERRADELIKMWHDDNIKALIAVRGGFGCLRLLSFINPTTDLCKPKILVGFSDITILHTYLARTLNLCTFHGPVLTSLHQSSKASIEQFVRCLMGEYQTSIKTKRLELLKKGVHQSGPLLGGNLCSLTTLLGTKYDYPWDNSVLFLEDTGEPKYKIDRMLTQLHLAGKLSNLSGLLLGDFSLSSEQEKLEKLRYTEFVWERVLELTSQENYPILGNFPVGHRRDNFTLPIGAHVNININSAELSFISTT